MRWFKPGDIVTDCLTGDRYTVLSGDEGPSLPECFVIAVPINGEELAQFARYDLEKTDVACGIPFHDLINEIKNTPKIKGL